MKSFSLVLLLVLFLGLFSVDRLRAGSESDFAITYVHPFEDADSFVGFTGGLLIGVSDSLPVHFGIRIDLSVNFVDKGRYVDDSFPYDIRVPLFLGLRVSYPLSFIVPYIELGPEASFDFDIVPLSRILGILPLAERKFNFNFGGGFGAGINFHIGSFIVGGVFRYHLHLDMSRHYFTVGVLFGGVI